MRNGEKGKQMKIPDSEVKAKKTQRRFTVKYKLEVLAKVEKCRRGELGEYLRKEGLYYGVVSRWKKEKEKGILVEKKRGRKAKEKNPLEDKVKKLEKEKANLEKKLERAEKLLEFQKKISELLEMAK